jgi:Ni/Fe-hydrogenase subunit HybB-like protein
MTHISQNSASDHATSNGVTSDLFRRHSKTGNLFKVSALVLAILFVLGIVGFILRISSDGTSNNDKWGYYAAVFAFILTTAQGAPMVAIAPRIVKAHWRRSTSRAAELWALSGFISTLVFVPLILVLPGLEDGRRSFWFYHEGEVARYIPHYVGALSVVAMAIAGLFLLWVSSLPDLAYIRDHGTGWRQKWAKVFARGWQGTSWQWFMVNHRMGILGAFYFMMLVFTHFVIVADFLMPFVPGWIDALFPATHAFNALQGGVATVLVTLFVMRKFGGYSDFIQFDQMWGLGKLLLATSLLWIWFSFSSFMIFWFGKKPNELYTLDLLMTGPYLWLFVAVFILVFIVPFFTLIWNPVRRSTWGPPLIACFVLVGTLFDRVRLYVAAYSVPADADMHGPIPLDLVPAAVYPDVFDILITIGVIAGAVLIYMLGTRLIPVINVWEQRELLIYQVHKQFHRTEVQVLGKPE